MKPVNLANKKNPTKNSTSENKQIQPATEEGANTLKRITIPQSSTEIYEATPLQNRDLSSLLIVEDKYSQDVIKTIKKYASRAISLIYQTLNSQNLTQYVVKSKDSDPIEKFVFEYAKAEFYLSKIKIKCLHNSKTVAKENIGTAEKGSIMDRRLSYSPGTSSNGILCWGTLIQILYKFFEYQGDRNIFSQFESTRKPGDTLVKGISPLIEETSAHLEKMWKEYYLSIFKVLIDPSIDLKSKLKEYFNYIGYQPCESEFLALVEKYDEVRLIHDHITNLTVRTLACYSMKIRNLIDCLNKIKSLPKTVNNLLIVYKVLNNCSSFYNEDLALRTKELKAGPNNNKCCEGYFKINSFLLDQLKKFNELISQASIKNIAELEGKTKTNKRSKLPASTENFKNEVLQAPRTKIEAEIPPEPKSPRLPEVKKAKDENEKINNTSLPTEDSNESLEEELKRLEKYLDLFYANSREQKSKRKKAKKPAQLEAKEPAKAEENKPTMNLTTEKLTIKVGNMEFTFQKLYQSTFLNDVWGVIITNNSVELQMLARYTQLLSNATIGSGSITQLKGFGDIYEIGSSTMDSRLLGKKYNDGILSALLKFMSETDAIQLNASLETHGINDKASLVIFSAEAKKHEDINSVARKL